MIQQLSFQSNTNWTTAKSTQTCWSVSPTWIMVWMTLKNLVRLALDSQKHYLNTLGLHWVICWLGWAWLSPQIRPASAKLHLWTEDNGLLIKFQMKEKSMSKMEITKQSQVTDKRYPQLILKTESKKEMISSSFLITCPKRSQDSKWRLLMIRVSITTHRWLEHKFKTNIKWTHRYPSQKHIWCFE